MEQQHNEDEKQDPKPRLASVTALLGSSGWQKVLLPELTARLKKHTEACCNPDLTPAQRAEHIEARRLCEELMGWPERIRRDLEHRVK
jgi:hypothetical protein